MTKHQHHPITPPPELVLQWRSEWVHNAPGNLNELGFLATRAAHWGADQELDACCQLLDNGEHAATYGCHNGNSLRAARRPKPPSLKAEALARLALLEQLITDLNGIGLILPHDKDDIIRRALEALPDD